MEGTRKLDESLLRQLVIVHDVLLVNVSDADMFGKKIYSVDRRDYIPPFVSESRKLKKISAKMRQEIIDANEDKLNHHGIAHTSVDTVDHVDRSLIELLEKHKMWK